VDPEFAGLIPPPAAEEQAQLEQNLLAEGGCRDALVVWQGYNLLLDGHHRLDLCRRHGLPYRTREVALPDREAAFAWVIANQLGRRNVTPKSASWLRGLRYNAEKQGHGGRRQRDGSSVQNAHLKTDERLAAEYKVDPSTIRRDGKFAEQVQAVAATCGDQARKLLLSEEAKLSRQEVADLAGMEADEQRQVVAELTQTKKEGRKQTAKRRTATKGKETLTVPVAPEALAEALLRNLGRPRAAKVHAALGRLLGKAGLEQGGRRRPGTAREAT
jgi:hypothetical protein